MSYRNPHRRAGLSGSVTIFMLIAMIAAAASGSLGWRERAETLPVAMSPSAPQKLRWTLDDIHLLIATIEESERSGFDSRRYGLAALQSELEQTTELWDRSGTRQLDMLAGIAALRLANDHRDRLGLAPITARDIDAALAEGDLHARLMAGA